ncbi:serine hydroxymethyltransferase [Candidatus Uhrbacteria bacterium]|nr:serine hydroxymethyltransferase [Candidatus Uhrbacteria bacterium]
MQHLAQFDPEIAQAITNELNRQQHGLEMIASENFVSEAILEAVGTVLTNKYSEGYPGKRYYGGNQFIDVVENLAIERVKKLFNAQHANVQPHSGSNANMQAYFALLNLGDTVLAMDLAAGGHMTHGLPVNFSAKFYKFVHYGVSPETGYIDMDQVRDLAIKHKPKLILAGASAYPRKFDFEAFKKIADEVNAYLMVDMAHIAGLVAAKLHPDPIPFADVVTSTTHKTLRGPRGLPGMQGGPLNHVIAGKAVCFKEASQPEFITYQKQVIRNAAVLADALRAQDFKLLTGGTDNHLVLVNLENKKVSGKEAEHLLDEVNIHTNKNMIPFDKRKPVDPSGLRLGTPALTTRGFTEDDMWIVGDLIAKVLNNPNDNNTKEQVRAKVADITASHPLYPNL